MSDHRQNTPRTEKPTPNEGSFAQTGTEPTPRPNARNLGISPPQKAIRAKCLECANSQYSVVRNCQITSCPLWPYRLGKHYRSREELEADRQRCQEGVSR